VLVATADDEVGRAVIDWQTPIHFGLGVAAGALGIEPHLAAVGFVGARVVNIAAEEGLHHALFSTKHAQSHANEMSDLLWEFIGLYLGGKARELIVGKPACAGLPLAGKIVGFDVRGIPMARPAPVPMAVW